MNHRVYQYPNISLATKDTIYTSVLINVEEGGESTRKNPKVNFSFIPELNASYKTNVPVTNGSIAYYRSDRGSLTAHAWTGSFAGDSLKLTYKIDDGMRFLVVYEFRARKQ